MTGQPVAELDAAPTPLEAMAWPDAAAAALAACPPGPEAVAALAVIDAARLSHGGRIDCLVALQRARGWLDAVEQYVLGMIAARPADAADRLDPTGRNWTREEVACALRLSPANAEVRMHVAAALTGPLRATLGELAAGRISYLHARAVVEDTLPLSRDPERRRAVEHKVLARAHRLTIGELHRATRRAVQAADPRSAEARHRESYLERRVTCRAQEDGMATLWAYLPADAAATVMRALNALADKDAEVPDVEGRPRTRDQRRSDALAQLAAAALSDPALPRRHGHRPAVHVTVALSTLMGADDHPADLDGESIPAGLARRIAADPGGTWRRLVVDPLGRLVDYGRSTYRPPADLRDHVLTRDRRCTFPGCHRLALDSDIDHHTAWVDGGRTDADNLSPACERHHRLKHEAGWTVMRTPDGAVEWTSPTGHRYARAPDPLPVDSWTPPATEPGWRPTYPPPPGPPVRRSAPDPDQPDPDPPPF